MAAAKRRAIDGLRRDRMRERKHAEIARELHISELTVKSHIGRIFTKLDLRDRPAAIVYAYDHQLALPR